MHMRVKDINFVLQKIVQKLFLVDGTLINCDVAPSASVKKSQGMMGGLGLPGQQSNKE